MEAIEKWYGGNKESKKVQRTLLKQQYENFTASRIIKHKSKSTKCGFCILQQHNEADNTAYGVSIAHTQGNTVYSTSVDNLSDVVICAFLEFKFKWSKSSFDRLKVECFNCYKNKHFAREHRAQKNQENKEREYGRKMVPVVNPTENAFIAQDGIGGYDWSYQVEEEHPTNFALMELTSLGSSSNLDFENLVKAEKKRDKLKLTQEKYQNSSKSLNTLLESQVSDKDKIGLGYKAASPAIENFVNSSKMIENQENVRSRSDKGYHAIPLPYTGNYIPPKHDLMFIDGQVESESMNVVFTISSSAVKTIELKVESVDVKNKGVCSTIETKPAKKNIFSLPIIEDWISNEESEVEFEPKAEDKNLCDMKWIKREFSVARTPQQNGVAKRMNRTLIEATSTNRLYETLWVSCYHLKYMDYLGKFDEKADEGFFVGYSMVSKAMRVFNKRTRIVEETLNIIFFENAPNVKGSRPDWLFDIDSLKISMNYMPIVVGFQTNGIGRTKDNIVASQAKKKKEPKQEYILIPICTNDPLIFQSLKDSAVDAKKRLLNSPVSTAGPSFANAASPSPINVAETPAKEEVDMNNVVSSYTIPNAPLIKFLKDHPKDQVFRNKKDDRGIVIKNKARLVAQGHTQEEGINYDKVFAPVARIKAIRLFLAYTSFKDFVVYQMDVNSAFLYGKIEEEVYVCQPPSFEDPNFPNKVYKVEKALYGLHQAPRACFSTVKTTSTTMEPNKALVKDAKAKDVDVHLYRSMIRSLMYLTASRPDITFAVCAYARFQVTPKTLHLHAVKRIFRFLKGQPKLSIWYPKDSPFYLEAYSDNDYVGASLDKKSTT
uniref:Retrovirus-related Pol polyprotein from transposon TNT 1-94 n=1 Tax=Tanacetum cinerariifolium TaxID=118510 RepID=A0A699HE58_TANCI|nr:retrovirus-related Pol polyprotein from transposon TNT 1-94 [Tanacetum cinerariifolium]